MGQNKDYGDIKTLIEMYKAVAKGKYPVPWAVICWVLFFIFYFVFPIDLVPDLIFPFFGFADDAALFVFILTRVKKEINRFKNYEAPKQIEQKIQDLKNYKNKNTEEKQ
ncbi:Uncharacterized conserved protein [Elusimicrobium minutum Pei191]|uniref:Uncharacterized conserved protein n=1 Tax=Elusimicrobium minutum (strain Pei191) TaxID=445932 RepID=B2KD12_ELUMP|nr:YkvA family protein [Elusimicrobium minutum]ACC98408.1 Uncharacterized conserved protein [Elusimicrobium minutum Pei191]